MHPCHFVINKQKKKKTQTVKISICKLHIVKPLNNIGISHTLKGEGTSPTHNNITYKNKKIKNKFDVTEENN